MTINIEPIAPAHLRLGLNLARRLGKGEQERAHLEPRDIEVILSDPIEFTAAECEWALSRCRDALIFWSGHPSGRVDC